MMELKKSQRGLTKSLVAILAEDMAEAGGEGLRQLTKRLDQSSTTLAPDAESFTDRSLTDQKAMYDSMAAILVGLSIVAIEETLINNELDLKTWYARYNLAISGTPFTKAVYLGQDREKLTDERWKKMLNWAETDKTLAIFFDRGLDSLPNSMQSFLNQAGRLNAIHRIMPIYRQRAQLLIT